MCSRTKGRHKCTLPHPRGASTCFTHKSLIPPADSRRGLFVGGALVISGTKIAIKIATGTHKLYCDRDSQDYRRKPDTVATCSITKKSACHQVYRRNADRFSGDGGNFWLPCELKF